MKVAINTLPLKTGHKTRGIGFYTKNLLEGLNNRPDIKIQEFADISEVSKADLVHYPFFDLFQRTLSLRKKFPTVITIHDVIPLVFPDRYPPGIKGIINNYYQKLALKNVEAVITDSEASKKDIYNYLGVGLNKIHTVYLAGGTFYHPIKDSKQLTLIKNKYKLPDKFALFIGSVNWNKNLLNLTKGCLKAGTDLVLVGKDFENEDNLDHPERISYSQFLKEFKSNPRVHILGFISDEDLAAIMNLARVLLLPSFYEGFGLPILDAQTSGTPVITSNISSMPEVAGDGALLVDPYSVESISQGIKKIREDKILKDKLIKEGFKNTKIFSWKKTVEQTVKVYQQIAV